jgi:hypothetical protein
MKSQFLEGMQRKIPAQMGIDWEAYRKRLNGELLRTRDDWPRGFAHFTLWWPSRHHSPAKREPMRFRARASDYAASRPARTQTDIQNAWALRLNGARTTADSPHYEETPLDQAVREHGKPGMAYKFLSDDCIAAYGYRGYHPVTSRDDSRDVRVGTLRMCEIPEAAIAARRARPVRDAKDAMAACLPKIPEGCPGPIQSSEGGDVWRVSWHFSRWRAVLALYSYYESPKRRYGLDFVSHVKGHHWRQYKWRFYKLSPASTHSA